MSFERRCPDWDGEQCIEDNGQQVQCAAQKPILLRLL